MVEARLGPYAYILSDEHLELADSSDEDCQENPENRLKI